MSEPPSVGIVTVNYNSAGFIGEFLGSISKIDYPRHRLIVVDAASSDGSVEEIERRCPQADVIRCDENVGIARGNNIGVERCRELGLDFALFVNNDTTHEPGFLRRLVDAADARTLAAPRILYADDHRLISTHAGDFDWNLGRFRNTHHGKPDGPETRRQREVQTASFCCMLVPLSVFADVGPLDERFFMYYEETDFLRRAREAGYRLLYVPDAVIYHRESASSGGGWMTPFKQYYAARNRLYLVRKHTRSPLHYAIFTLFYWAGRISALPRFFIPQQRALLKAQLLGMLHYYQGRMGRTLEVHDF
ncbi:MAG: glycosyltransferase family 2 protein [Dehalococcoidia bacterium]